MTHLSALNKAPPTSELDQWLGEIRAMTGLTESQAKEVFASVCRALADHVPSSGTSGLIAQLPASVRQRMDQDLQPHSAVEQRNFVAQMRASCPTLGPHQAERAIWAVFTMLSHHLSPPWIRHVRDLLPKEVRALWNTAV